MNTNTLPLSHPHPLAGFSIAVSPHLAGSKRAIRQGSTIYVSPAMYDLMKNANETELKALCEAIEVMEIPEMPSMFEALPMRLCGEPSSYNYAAGVIDSQRSNRG